MALPAFANELKKSGRPLVSVLEWPVAPQSTIAFSVNAMIGPP